MYVCLFVCLLHLVQVGNNRADVMLFVINSSPHSIEAGEPCKN